MGAARGTLGCRSWRDTGAGEQGTLAGGREARDTRLGWTHTHQTVATGGILGWGGYWAREAKGHQAGLVPHTPGWGKRGGTGWRATAGWGSHCNPPLPGTGLWAPRPPTGPSQGPSSGEAGTGEGRDCRRGCRSHRAHGGTRVLVGAGHGGRGRTKGCGAGGARRGGAGEGGAWHVQWSCPRTRLRPRPPRGRPRRWSL